VVFGHQGPELAKALGDLLFGGAELIQNGHAFSSGTGDRCFTILREDLHNLWWQACNQKARVLAGLPPRTQPLTKRAGE
jgi:hypothetical protein